MSGWSESLLKRLKKNKQPNYSLLPACQSILPPLEDIATPLAGWLAQARGKKNISILVATGYDKTLERCHFRAGWVRWRSRVPCAKESTSCKRAPRAPSQVYTAEGHLHGDDKDSVTDNEVVRLFQGLDNGLCLHTESSLLLVPLSEGRKKQKKNKSLIRVKPCAECSPLPSNRSKNYSL